jgi:hypothetical protein
MKRIILSTGVVLFVVALVLSFSTTIQSHVEGNFKYIGVQKCAGACHKSDAQGKQLDIWQGSAHANAWKVLESPEADKIAKDKGFGKASETPACIKCHVLGKDIDPSELTETFDKTQGVQCETCHGAGSEYKAMSIMKDKQKAIENGLNVPSDIQSLCTGCHNSESPTFKSFNFDESWAKIQHKKP